MNVSGNLGGAMPYIRLYPPGRRTEASVHCRLFAQSNSLSLALIVSYRTTGLRVNSLNNMLEKKRNFGAVKICRLKNLNLSMSCSHNTLE